MDDVDIFNKIVYKRGMIDWREMRAPVLITLLMIGFLVTAVVPWRAVSNVRFGIPEVVDSEIVQEPSVAGAFTQAIPYPVVQVTQPSVSVFAPVSSQEKLVQAQFFNTDFLLYEGGHIEKIGDSFYPVYPHSYIAGVNTYQ